MDTGQSNKCTAGAHVEPRSDKIKEGLRKRRFYSKTKRNNKNVFTRGMGIE
jgi:hypothetical protein